ncbi:MAG: nickel pincer cofactor biosynthesis protein LarC [Planctomycetes bacterium]|nr:nickel pincer cofactor biosynthesis protein LarC [Planctomycetota bacterium]
MNRIAYLDPFSGASGDMILGALVDCGLEAASLERMAGGLGIGSVRIAAEPARRGAITAIRLEVLATGEHHAHRSFREIARIIGGAPLSEAVRTRATAAFRRLAEAEGRVHGVPADDVHFHEVGAVDSIVDIVGAAWAIEALGIEEVRSAPPAVGTGSVGTQHGEIPLPAPATLEVLRGFPVRHRDSGRELTTPTGAAILTSFARAFGPAPDLILDRIGYGAGADRPGGLPNVLRVWLGQTPASGADPIDLIETNVDDAPAEWLGYLAERLFSAGALDVYFTPIFMKKSRPAYQVSVVATPDRTPDLEAILFAESTTFGLRRTAVGRSVLDRAILPAETPWGPIRIKVGSRAGAIVSAAPEFDDVREAAIRAGVPLREVHRAALESFHRDRREGAAGGS